MRFSKLIPELSVSSLEKSLAFYEKILGFRVEYQREESKFAFLSLQGSQIMLDQGNIAKVGNIRTPLLSTQARFGSNSNDLEYSDKGSPWFTGVLDYPRGRGVHFQIEVRDISVILNRLKKHEYPIKHPPKEYWFRKDDRLIGMKGFLVMDPDGYLLMFNESIGAKNLK